jgi:hypothetical protein
MLNLSFAYKVAESFHEAAFDGWVFIDLLM